MSASSEATTTLLSVAVDVYTLDPVKRHFCVSHPGRHAALRVDESCLPRMGYALVIGTSATASADSLSFPVSSELLPSCPSSSSSSFDLQFVHGGSCYAVKATGSRDEGADLQRLFMRCLWETNSQRPFQELKREEQAYVSGGLQQGSSDCAPCLDDEPFLFDDDPRSATPPRMSSSSSTRCSAQTPEEAFFRTPLKKRTLAVPMTAPSHLEGNSLLSVSYNSDRSFVGRGDRIGVFRQGDEDLQFYTSLSPLKTKGGKTFTPTQMMLHDQDSSLLLVDKERPTAVYKMDLERGVVVQEWQTEGASSSCAGQFPISNLNPTSKHAQRTASPLVMAHNTTSIFTIDGRLERVQRVDQLTYTYGGTTKAVMTAMATTQDGHVVCGSADGSVRLFHKNALHTPKKDLLDRIPRAKSLLPGFGDPITAIDVTSDGHWVLATCDTYLLLIPTSATPGSGPTGFSKALGASKPVPIMLRPRPEDILTLGGTVRFRPARFNVSSGPEQERSIITASGSFSLIWNFAQVVSHGARDAYTLKRFDDNVTVSQFAFDDDSKILVALADDVQLARRSRLQPRKIF